MMLHAYKLKIPQPIPRGDKIRSSKRSKTNDTLPDGGAVIDHDMNDNNHESKTDDNDHSSDNNSVSNGDDDDTYDKLIRGVYRSDDNDQICDTQTNGDVVRHELNSKDDFNENTEFLVDVTTEDPFVFVNGTLVIS